MKSKTPAPIVITPNTHWFAPPTPPIDWRQLTWTDAWFITELGKRDERIKALEEEVAELRARLDEA